MSVYGLSYQGSISNGSRDIYLLNYIQTGPGAHPAFGVQLYLYVLPKCLHVLDLRLRGYFNLP